MAERGRRWAGRAGWHSSPRLNKDFFRSWRREQEVRPPPPARSSAGGTEAERQRGRSSWPSCCRNCGSRSLHILRGPGSKGRGGRERVLVSGGPEAGRGLSTLPGEAADPERPQWGAGGRVEGRLASLGAHAGWREEQGWGRGIPVQWRKVTSPFCGGGWGPPVSLRGSHRPHCGGFSKIPGVMTKYRVSIQARFWARKKCT